MSLAFFAPDHTYTLDGVRVPSVTGVLHRAGLIDFSHVPPSILAAALERGRVVHQAIHFWNERDLDVAAFDRQFPECAPYLHGWIACAWCASLTGDTAAEVVAFLRALWQDHKTQRHQPPVERAS